MTAKKKATRAAKAKPKAKTTRPTPPAIDEGKKTA
jgi:hypothetical protein